MVVLLFLLAVVPSQTAGRRAVPEDYRLQIGDEVVITVSGNINFSYSDSVSPQGNVFVQSGGTISSSGLQGNVVIPSGETILSSVKVINLTLSEAREVIQDEFNKYFKNINVSLAIKGFRDVVYVSGEVVIPGAYPFFPGKTIKDYIGLAGGFTDRANLKKSYVLKEGEVKVPIDKAQVDRGDVIVVKRVFLKWWEDYLTIASAIATVVIAWLTIAK